MAQKGARQSTLLLDEFFGAQDDRFLSVLREVRDPRSLAAFTERWKKDPRPWAREQILKYAAEPMNVPGHQPVVKRLYKHAEAQKQDAIVAAFLVAFDRLVRRVAATRYNWDPVSRQGTRIEYLSSPRNSMKGDAKARYVAERWKGVLFSYHTRFYLRRRAWRYFRRLGKQRPTEYVPLSAQALMQYTDADVATGEHILDSWSLLQICFGKSDVLDFSAHHAALKEGRGLHELKPAPHFSKLWAAPGSADVLMDLVLKAPARLVRVWASGLLREKHSEWLNNLPVETITRLLDHDDEDLQQFGAKVLVESPRLASLPLEQWLRLLKTRNLIALQTVCDLFQKHVLPERIDLAGAVELASAQPVPVARLGVVILKARTPKSDADRAIVSLVAHARCAAVCGEIADWAIALLGSKEHYDRDAICQFFDSTHAAMRTAAWAWLVKEGSPGYDDAALWARLIETPYDDLRLRIVEQLTKRSGLPGTPADALAPVWASVLLSIHRGGRQKSQAVRQIGSALIEKPERAAALISVLAVAVRSVRGSEFRAGLASLVSAIERKPELARQVQLAIPELQAGSIELPAASAAGGGE